MHTHACRQAHTQTYVHAYMWTGRQQAGRQTGRQAAQVQISDRKIGETVLLSQKKKNNFSMTFDLAPFQVTRIKGTMVTAIGNRKYVTHNISQFKKIVSDMVRPELPHDNLDAWEDNNEDITPQGNPQLNVLPLNPPQSVCNRHYPVRIRPPVLRYDSNNELLEQPFV